MMTPERLAEAITRAQRKPAWTRGTGYLELVQVFLDRAALAAEVDRLRAQVAAIQGAAERVYFRGDGLIEGEELLIILGKDPNPPANVRAALASGNKKQP